MKKIVGLLLAGAMALSAFAADLTGAVRLEGDLFKYDGKTKQVDALMIKPHQESYWGPLTLSISSDRAGGTLKMWDGGADKLSVGKWAIWFKPMDMLKVNLGAIAKDLNKKLQVVDMSFDGLIAAVQSGAVDFVAAGMTATDERRQNVDFSEPYYESNQVIIVRK